MITLHQFGPAFTLRTGSPFGLKLEAFMRLSGIPYRVEPFSGNPGKAPKGKSRSSPTMMAAGWATRR